MAGPVARIRVPLSAAYRSEGPASSCDTRRSTSVAVSELRLGRFTPPSVAPGSFLLNTVAYPTNFSAASLPPLFFDASGGVRGILVIEEPAILGRCP